MLVSYITCVVLWLCTVCTLYCLIYWHVLYPNAINCRDWINGMIMHVCTLCSSLHSHATSSLFGPNIPLNTLFWNILSLRSSLNVSDQVSHPYITTGNSIVLYILIFKFLDSRLDYVCIYGVCVCVTFQMSPNGGGRASLNHWLAA